MDEKKQEEYEKKRAKDEKDETVYTEEGREELAENDEISADEEGFMKGEEEASFDDSKKDEIED